MPKVIEGDPCRVLLRVGPVNRNLVDRFSANPHMAVWWPEDDPDNSAFLEWLRANQPGFVTEVEFPDISAEIAAAPADAPIIGVPMRQILSFPTPEGASAYVVWHVEHIRAWRERHEAVTDTTPCWCWNCGGPMEGKRDVTRVARIQDIEMTYTGPRFWCEHCGTDAHSVTPGSHLDDWRHESTLIFAIRDHLGLKKGMRALPGEGEPRVRIAADANSTVADIRAALASGRQ